MLAISESYKLYIPFKLSIPLHDVHFHSIDNYDSDTLQVHT